MTHRALNGLKAHLDAGVTTIRDVGGLHGIDLEMQHLVDEDKVEGPQVFASGKLISMTGGHACLLGAQVNSPDEARKAARQNLMDGARLLKVIATGGVLTHGVQPGAAQLTEAEMAAVCEEARKAGKIVAAHAQGAEGIENALRAGVHSIEHGFWLSDQAIAMMTAGGQVMVPTFAALRAMQRLGDQLPQSIQDKIEESHPAHLDSFQRAMRAGCTIACGTDAGTPANPHGNIADEIAAFRQSGMAIHDCWRSATREGAVACGLEDRGVLGAGKRADLCAVSREVFEMIPEVLNLIWWSGAGASSASNLNAADPFAGSMSDPINGLTRIDAQTGRQHRAIHHVGIRQTMNFELFIHDTGRRIRSHGASAHLMC